MKLELVIAILDKEGRQHICITGQSMEQLSQHRYQSLQREIKDERFPNHRVLLIPCDSHTKEAKCQKIVWRTLSSLREMSSSFDKWCRTWRRGDEGRGVRVSGCVRGLGERGKGLGQSMFMLTISNGPLSPTLAAACECADSTGLLGAVKIMPIEFVNQCSLMLLDLTPFVKLHIHENEVVKTYPWAVPDQRILVRIPRVLCPHIGWHRVAAATPYLVGGAGCAVEKRTHVSFGNLAQLAHAGLSPRMPNGRPPAALAALTAVAVSAIAAGWAPSMLNKDMRRGSSFTLAQMWCSKWSVLNSSQIPVEWKATEEWGMAGGDGVEWMAVSYISINGKGKPTETGNFHKLHGPSATFELRSSNSTIAVEDGGEGGWWATVQQVALLKDTKPLQVTLPHPDSGYQPLSFGKLLVFGG
ncbi:hypothetical protein BDK51DRAFT_33884 [Blyttiomyces helicus]|uniref:Uncharacterized protein n=1 Tax=Blyttiomyces helicus TaxID=388810 RepID=A0A4P9WQD7_9FUNG|nr:hypothetical protein BDK51DRAFT_33884 [Blyttiomyces helicus]|eukprot:RKO94595.1 hypothetical protein BDK51DRAFT_33884 [Blyttiomyces helicus]